MTYSFLRAVNHFTFTQRHESLPQLKKMKILLLYLCVAFSLNEVAASSCSSNGYTINAYTLESSLLNPSGLFVSRTCVWRLKAGPGYAVELTFNYLVVGSTSYCSSNYISIRDGYFSSSVELGKACGSKKPPIIRSRGQWLYLKLATTGLPSFKLTFKAVKLITSTTKCTSSNSFYNNNNLRFSSSSGNIRSPNYPFNYPSGIQCTWILTVPSGKKAELSFNSFINLEGGYCSSNDYIQVRDGSSNSKLFGTYCSGKPSNIKASGRTIWVRFRSDEDSRNGKGFEARYSTQSTTYNSGSSSGSSSNAGAIVGIIFGVGVFIAVIVVISFCIKRGTRGAVVARSAPTTTVAVTTTNRSVAAAQKQPGYYPPPAQQTGYCPPPPAQQPGYYPPQAQQPGYYPPQAQQPGYYPPQAQQLGHYPPPAQQPGQVPSAYPMGPVGAHPSGPHPTGGGGQYPPGQSAGYPPGAYASAPPDAGIEAPPPPYPGL